MTSLLVFKDRLREFYGLNHAYIRPFLKFLATFFSMFVLHAMTGYTDILGSPVVILALALVCAFLPNNLDVIIICVYLLGEVYTASMEVALILLICFAVMYCLYFKFAPGDSVILLLLPVLMMLKIPYVIPIMAGLLLTPFSIFSVAFGTFLYYALIFVSGNSAALAKTGSDTVSSNMAVYIKGVLDNETMYAVMVVFAATLVIVYMIRRLPIRNARIFASAAGSLVQMIGFILVRMTVDPSVSIVEVILMNVLSGVIAGFISFIITPLDYSRTESVQFEDDEYYYYVRAVPKFTVTRPEVHVKKINARREKHVKQIRQPERSSAHRRNSPGRQSGAQAERTEQRSGGRDGRTM